VTRSRFITRDIVLDGKATKPQSAEAVTTWISTLEKPAPARGQ
jgi:hypothetical protein